jgi:hypothetical protein
MSVKRISASTFGRRSLAELARVVASTPVLAFVPLMLVSACSSDSDETETDVVADASSPSDGSSAPGGDADNASPDVVTAPIVQRPFDFTRISSNDGEGRNVRVATSEVSFDGGPFASATLRVQLDSTCFPFEDWSTPPAGHNWPADCDAFDRNFEFMLDEPTAEGDPPAYELVRAITPFGGPMEFEVDVTDLANTLTGAHSISVRISTWSDGAGQVSGSDGGWNVTADLELVPGAPPANVLAVIPLYNASLGADAPVENIQFTMPDGARSAVLEYRTTGHGGGEGGRACIGPAEEFCERDHTVFIDDEPSFFLRPWRDDCETLCTLENNGRFEYCAENPCGSVSSVRAPRANWCPGDVTPPEEFLLDADALTGEHTFRFDVANVAAGGSWRTSAVLYVYGGDNE